MSIEKLADLASEWHPDNPKSFSDYTVGSGYKARWQCSTDARHVWVAPIFSRTSGTGCPICSGRSPLVGVNDLLTLFPEVAKFWHPTKNEKMPSEYLPKSSRSVWWLCPEGHEFERTISNAHRSLVCPLCSGNTLVVGVNDLLSQHPDIAKEWHSDNVNTPQSYMKGSDFSAKWQCSVDSRHMWTARISARTVAGTGCPVCAGRAVLAGVNDLQTLFPQIADQWHPEKNSKPPFEYLPKSNAKVWWLCSEGHEWVANIASRHRSLSCPHCTGKRLTPGCNDLMSKYPEVAKEWHPVKNSLSSSEVFARSSAKVFWRCSVDASHEWEASVCSRVGAHPAGCPYCSGLRPFVGVNDLETLYPEIASQWSPSNEKGPSEVTAGSDFRAEWVCDEGHSWVSRVANRSRRGSDCPKCQSSGPEKSLGEFLEKVVKSPVTLNDKKILGGRYELDFYFPEQSIAVEFNGVYWHSEAGGRDRYYHQKKVRQALSKGIQLIQVWEDDWRDRRSIVERMLKHKLGVSDQTKIYARKTEACEVGTAEAQIFLNANHIQGFVGNTKYLALKHDGALVALAAFKRTTTTGEWVLTRYATSVHVVGGFSKLLKYFEQTTPNLKRLVTFADLSLSDGSLYHQTGFVCEKELPPNYSYLVNGSREHKFAYRKKRFRDDDKLLFNPDMTESELARLNNLHRVWDSGKLRFVKYYNNS